MLRARLNLQEDFECELLNSVMIVNIDSAQMKHTSYWEMDNWPELMVECYGLRRCVWVS